MLLANRPLLFGGAAIDINAVDQQAVTFRRGGVGINAVGQQAVTFRRGGVGVRSALAAVTRGASPRSNIPPAGLCRTPTPAQSHQAAKI
jgi:hypothetical protein